jgi:predicted AAA+ superfamily ATPase
LSFNGIAISSESDYAVQKTSLEKCLWNTCVKDNFPEVALKKEDSDKFLLLKHYFGDIVFRDVVARHEIRDTFNSMNLAVFLLTSIARTTSTSKLKKISAHREFAGRERVQPR